MDKFEEYIEKLKETNKKITLSDEFKEDLREKLEKKINEFR